jgi:hypothetical protein
MLSRIKSLKGLCILRPFRLETIQKHISEELRDELTRMEELERASTNSNGITKCFHQVYIPQKKSGESERGCRLARERRDGTAESKEDHKKGARAERREARLAGTQKARKDQDIRPEADKRRKIRRQETGRQTRTKAGAPQNAHIWTKE